MHFQLTPFLHMTFYAFLTLLSMVLPTWVLNFRCGAEKNHIIQNNWFIDWNESANCTNFTESQRWGEGPICEAFPAAIFLSSIRASFTALYTFERCNFANLFKLCCSFIPIDLSRGPLARLANWHWDYCLADHNVDLLIIILLDVLKPNWLLCCPFSHPRFRPQHSITLIVFFLIKFCGDVEREAAVQNLDLTI